MIFAIIIDYPDGDGAVDRRRHWKQMIIKEGGLSTHEIHFWQPTQYRSPIEYCRHVLLNKERDSGIIIIHANNWWGCEPNLSENEKARIIYELAEIYNRFVFILYSGDNEWRFPRLDIGNVNIISCAVNRSGNGFITTHVERLRILGVVRRFFEVNE